MDSKNNIEDFLADEEFIRWVKHPDKELNVFWRRWIQLNPDKRDLLIKAREIMLNTHFEHYQVDEIAEELILDHILSNTTSTDKVKKNKQKALFYTLSKVAASIILLVTSLFFLREYHNSSIKSENIAIIKEVITNVTKYNPNGKKSIITLPDGSTVWLNSGSKLSYPSKFAENERIIQLDGQAFFDVKKDSLKPFRVNSSGLVTTALGTSFDINSYNDFNDDISISLVTGKIVVKNESLKSNDVVLPGEQLVYSVKKQRSRIKMFDSKEVLSWKERRLYFKNASLQEVMVRLERWYGVKVSLKNNPGENWKLNGEFEKMSLEDVLKRISFSKDFRFNISGKEVVLIF